MSDDQVKTVYFDPMYQMVFTPSKRMPFHAGELCKSGEALLSAGQGSGVGCAGEQGGMSCEKDDDCGPTAHCESKGDKKFCACAPHPFTASSKLALGAISPYGHQMTHEADAHIC